MRHRTGGLLLVSLSAVLVLGACSPEPLPAPSAPPTSASQSPAEALAAEVRKAVNQMAENSPNPSQQQFRDVLSPFASSPSDVEVAVSRTPTGLAVDTIQGAVKAEGACIVSGVRDGVASTTVLPVLSDGLCFVGSQR